MPCPGWLLCCTLVPVPLSLHCARRSKQGIYALAWEETTLAKQAFASGSEDTIPRMTVVSGETFSFTPSAALPKALFFKGLLHTNALCSRKSSGNEAKGKEPAVKKSGDKRKDQPSEWWMKNLRTLGMCWTSEPAATRRGVGALWCPAGREGREDTGLPTLHAPTGRDISICVLKTGRLHQFERFVDTCVICVCYLNQLLQPFLVQFLFPSFSDE